jgi:hypothetical protein
MPYLFSTNYSPIAAAGARCYLFFSLSTAGDQHFFRWRILSQWRFSICCAVFSTHVSHSNDISGNAAPGSPTSSLDCFIDGTPSGGRPTFLSALHDKSTYLLVVVVLYLLLFVAVGWCLFVIGHFFYCLRGLSIVRKLATTITKRSRALSRFAFHQFTLFDPFRSTCLTRCSRGSENS